jgi:hypothetical protein
MRDRSAIIGISILAVLVLLVGLLRNLGFVHTGPSKTGTIMANLRLIEGAKQVWALDHHQTGPVAVTKEDLAPYLTHPPYVNGFPKPVAGEQYTIGLLTESPEAELTHELGQMPKGTRFLLAETNEGIILPNPQGGANGGQPAHLETNRTPAAAAPRRSP